MRPAAIAICLAIVMLGCENPRGIVTGKSELSIPAHTQLVPISNGKTVIFVLVTTPPRHIYQLTIRRGNGTETRANVAEFVYDKASVGDVYSSDGRLIKSEEDKP